MYPVPYTVLHPEVEMMCASVCVCVCVLAWLDPWAWNLPADGQCVLLPASFESDFALPTHP